ncbi:MAG: hypothetical protein LBM38_03285 [Clostridiales bacterium]|jgi:hypothetical protein|nr:hypothetical protein [Clostridiales bacterium]
MKKLFVIIPIFIIIIAIPGFFAYDSFQPIPDDYIAVFHGGSGEQTYSTYIYKIDNGRANMGFKYINTTNTIVSGSGEQETKVTKIGEFDWTDGAFVAAEKNGAYDYVESNGNKYTIDEFKGKFIMN